MNKIYSLYLNQPTREFGLALDDAASFINNDNGRTLCVLSSEKSTVELIKRLPKQLTLIGTNGFDVPGFISKSAGWQWGKLIPGELNRSSNQFDVMIWVDPETINSAFFSQRLYQIAHPKTNLIVILLGILHGFIPGTEGYSWNSYLSIHPFHFLRTLRRTGWRINQAYGLHGPQSILWSNIYRFCTLVGRHDLADRSLFAVRNTYRQSGRFWWFSPVWFIRASPI